MPDDLEDMNNKEEVDYKREYTAEIKEWYHSDKIQDVEEVIANMPELYDKNMKGMIQETAAHSQPNIEWVIGEGFTSDEDKGRP